MMNKLNEEYILNLIVEKKFIKIFDKTTVCCIKLVNGFEIVGTSACVDKANYNQEIGEKIALENAIEQIWLVEGYLLQSKLNDN